MSKTTTLHRNRVMRMTIGDDASRAVDLEKREVTFTLSSEAPIEDWPGEFMILDHSPDSVDLTRLTSAGPLLFNHDRDQHLGRIVGAEVSNRKLNVTVRFGNSDLAKEKFQDVQDGILSEVSVSAKIHNVVLEESESDGVETHRAMKWEPLEASLVTVPADITVGINRDSKTNANDTITISREENITMSKDITPAPEKVIEIDTKAVERAVKAEQSRVGEINRIGAAHSIPAKDIQAAVESGAPLEDFQRTVLSSIGAKPITTPETQEIGLSRKEKAEYSITAAIHGQANQIAGTGKFDGLEREVSDAISKKIGRTAKGFFMPMADLSLKRDLSAGVDAKGGYTVQTDVLGGSLIELLRNKTQVFGLGTRLLSGLQGDIAIPKADGGATAYWLAEAAAVTPSDQNFAQVGLTPKRLAAATAYTKQLVAQSSIDVENFVRDDLMRVIALAIDLAVLEGTGAAGQPTGILNTAGINTVTFGAAPTWAKVVEFETAVATDNADIGSLNYLTTPGVRGAWKTTAKAANTSDFLWQTNDTPVNGYGADVTNQITNDKVFYGDFSQSLVGMWDGMDVVVDPYSLSLNGQIRIVMQNLVDVAIRHAESFCVSTDAGNQ